VGFYVHAGEAYLMTSAASGCTACYAMLPDGKARLYPMHEIEVRLCFPRYVPMRLHLDEEK